MTREEAIQLISRIYVPKKDGNVLGFKKERFRGSDVTWGDDIEEALNMAITALEQEPCVDAISREEVLKKQYRINDSATLSIRDVVNVEDIEDEPPVTPSRPKGHWIYEGAGYCHCSVCETSRYGTENFCPKCGTKMFEPQERRK